MTTMVAVDGLTKRFGHILAADNLSLTVDRGEVPVFLESKGSGKSTTMKIITGPLRPSAGDAAIQGARSASERQMKMPHAGDAPESVLVVTQASDDVSA